MRAYIAELLNNDQGLRDIGLAQDQVYAFQAVGLISPPLRPWIVLNWTTQSAGLGRASRRQSSQMRLLEVWVYDDIGDYTRIDRIITRVKDIFDSVQAQATEDGWITQIDWLDDGGDSIDEVYNAIDKRTSFYVVGSTTAS